MSDRSWRRDAWACAALFALAALVRVLFLWSTVDRELPFSIFYYGDSRVYREFALAILRGEAYDQGLPFHPPGFAYTLAAVIGLTGERPGWMRALLAIASATSVPLTYLLGLRIWGRAVAWTGALLATFSFGLLVTSVSANTETIYVPLLAAQVLLLVALGDAIYERRGRAAAGYLIASGIVLGLGALTRAEHLAMLALLPAALWIGWRSIGARRTLGVAVRLAVLAALVTAPWTIRGFRAITRFNATNPASGQDLPALVPISGYGPLNFALANNASADGTFRADVLLAPMGRGKLDLNDPGQREMYLHGYRLGWEYLAGHPRAALLLLWRKADLAADAFALGLGGANWPGGLRGTRRSVDLFVPDRRFLKPVALVLLLCGAWFSRSHWRRASVVGLTALHLTLLALVFFGYARLFVQITPLVACVQAAALVGWSARICSPGARRAVAAAGLLVALGFLVQLGLAARSPRNFRASGSVDPVSGKILQDAPVDLVPVP